MSCETLVKSDIMPGVFSRPIGALDGSLSATPVSAGGNSVVGGACDYLNARPWATNAVAAAFAGLLGMMLFYNPKNHKKALTNGNDSTRAPTAPEVSVAAPAVAPTTASSSTTTASSPSSGTGAGILGMDVYFPSTYVAQHDLESFDGVGEGKYTKGLGQEGMVSLCGGNKTHMCMSIIGGI